MDTHTGKFFEVTAKVLSVREDGTEKKSNQTIVVESYTFGDAEQRAFEEFSSYSKDYDIENVTLAQYQEIVKSGKGNDDKFFKCKIYYTALDESTAKEKKTGMCILVNADTTNTAQKTVDEYMKESLSDYSVAAIVETKIMNCFFK